MCCQLLVDYRFNKKIIWPLLVEKAVAKEYGSYANLNGGAIDYALMLITGNPAFRYNLLNDEIQLRVADNSLWVKILDFVQKGFLLGAGTLPIEEIPRNYEQIAGAHAYAVLDAFEFDGHKLLQLRDPRGTSAWVGEWSASSEKWTSRLKEMIAKRGKQKTLQKIRSERRLVASGTSPVPRSQKTFFVSWSEFVKCFEVIFVSIFFDNAWDSVKISDEWKEGQAGGSAMYPKSVKNNPQYLLSVTEEIEVFCLLENLAPASMIKIPKIGFEIYRYNGKLIGEGGIMPELIEIGRYSAERAISLNCVLEEGQYVLLLSTYEPNQYGEFTFTLWYPKDAGNGSQRKLALNKMELSKD